MTARYLHFDRSLKNREFFVGQNDDGEVMKVWLNVH